MLFQNPTCLAFIGMIAFGVSSLLWAAEPSNAKRPEPNNGPATVLPSQIWNPSEREKTTGTAAKYLRQAQRIIRKFDRDGSETLKKDEWSAMPVELAKIKGARDGVITVEELAAYLMQYANQHPLKNDDTAWQRMPQPPADLFQPVTPARLPGNGPPKGINAPPGDNETPPDTAPPTDAPPPTDEKQPGDTPHVNQSESSSEPSSKNEPSQDEPQTATPEETTTGAPTPKAARGKNTKKFYVSPATLPSNLPDWFKQLDANGDGQLTLSEYARDGSAAQRQQFKRYDLNGDGVLTPEEATNAGAKSTEKKKST
jgi:hypothetical protein